MTRGPVCPVAGKDCHASRADASAALRALEAHRGLRDGHLEPYRCGHCAAWHIGNRPGTSHRSRRPR